MTSEPENATGSPTTPGSGTAGLDASFLLEMTDLLESAEDLPTIARRATRQLLPMSGAHVLAVLRATPARLEVVATAGDVPPEAAPILFTGTSRTEGTVWDHLDAGQSLFIDHYPSAPGAHPSLVAAGTTALAHVAFDTEHDARFFLGAYRLRDPAPWTQQQKALLVTAARILGAVAKRVRRTRELLDTLSYSQALLVALHASAFAENASEAAAAVSQTLAEVADVDLALLARVDGEGVQFEVEHRTPAVSDELLALLTGPIPREQSLAAARVSTGIPAFVDDYPGAERAFPPAVEAGVRSVALVPLTVDPANGPSAFLAVRVGRPRVWSRRDRELFEAAASAVRAADERACRLRELADAARTDALTGLPNRRAWLADVSAALAVAARHRQPLTIVAYDLDGMKRVNDRDGHARGDQLLRAFANELTRQFRRGDRAYRLGGDEFVVLLPQARCDEVLQAELATRARAVGETLVAAGFAGAGASFGAAGFPSDGDTVDEVLAVADRRLYAVKAARHR